MAKYLKHLLLLFILIFIFFISNNVYAEETQQNFTVVSSIGKFSLNQYDNQSLPTTVSNTSMSIGIANTYYLPFRSGGRTSYFRRYWTNLTTSLVNGTSYHVRIVFFRELGINYTGLGLTNRTINYDVTVLNGGVNASNVSSSITRNSTTSQTPFNVAYDRVDIYFTANVTTSDLIISVGELTTSSYMYFNSTNNSIYENLRFGVNGIYVFSNPVNTGTNQQDMIAQQHQSNTFLGTIIERIKDFHNTVHSLLQNIKDKIDEFRELVIQAILDFKNSMENKINDLKNFFSNSSIDENDVNDFFDSLEFYDDSSLGGVVSAPITFINGLGTDSCAPLTLTVWNSSFTLPCGTTLFWSRIGNWYHFWSIIFGGVIIYRLSLKLFKVVNDCLDPQKDSVGGLDV